MTTTVPRPATEASAPDVLTPDAPNSRPAVPATAPDDVPLGGPTSPAAVLRSTPRLRTPQGISTTGRRVPSATRGMGAAGSDVPDPAARHQTTPMGVSPLDPVPRGQGAEHSMTPGSGSLLDPALCLAADILDDIERVRVANENRLRQLTRVVVDKDGEERGFGLDESHPDVARLAAMVATLKSVEHDATLELQRKLRKHPLGAWVKAQRGVGEKQCARLLAAIGDPYVNSAKGAPRTVSALWAYAGLHVLPAGHGALDAQLNNAGRNQFSGGQFVADAQPADAAGVQRRDTDHCVHDDRSTFVGVADGGNLGRAVQDAQSPCAGVAAKRRKGERANWSTKAKMRAYLIAESCIKQLGPGCRDGQATGDTHRGAAVPAPDDVGRDGHRDHDTQGRVAVAACACSPYRVKYDARRAHTAVTHPEWTDGHSHSDGLRVASKEVLKDLWRAARQWHLTQPGATR